jgi:NTE family protein
VSVDRLVCVLSGGGAKAAAHVGALRALEERELTPARFVGTSMGAVVAACFACGLGYEEVLRRIALLRRAAVAVPSPGLLLGPLAGNLLQGGPLEETIAALVPARRFSDLAAPLTVTAVDAANGRLVLFGAGGRTHVPLVDALYASCALPVYYPPKRIGDRSYIDGGMRAVLPLDVAARFDPDLLFAVHVGPWLLDEAPEHRAFSPPLLDAHNTATGILMAAQAEEAIARFRDGPVPFVLVRPTLEREGTFRVDAVGEYVAEGYRAAVRALASAYIAAPSAEGA